MLLVEQPKTSNGRSFCRNISIRPLSFTNPASSQPAAPIAARLQRNLSRIRDTQLRNPVTFRSLELEERFVPQGLYRDRQ